VSATSRWQNLVILYDRLTPAAQQRLIERFVQHDLDRLVELTTLRYKLTKKALDRPRLR